MRKNELKKITALLLTLFFLMCSVPAFAGGKININTADKETLDSIEHIGPVYAERIIEYREEHPFKSIEEIKKIKGIGEQTYQDIKDEITVGEG
ncbi:MAG: helix-hairpin-helix domain-containing protein [Desulfobacteraceae bacterium]